MVHVGVSAGSMVAPSYLADTYTGHKNLRCSDVKPEEILLASPQGELSRCNIAVASGMGLVDSALFPHLLDGAVEVVSEGHWKRFTP
jgi:hypothetical protein